MKCFVHVSIFEGEDVWIMHAEPVGHRIVEKGTFVDKISTVLMNFIFNICV